MRSVSAVCIAAPRAEPLITMPISASQTPLKRSPVKVRAIPPAMKR